MQTLFISDLHLQDSRPGLLELLKRFLRGPACAADALYILGDLFEFWIGDDALSPTAQAVGAELARLPEAGTACYFMHGNRDFLLGREYAAQAGLQLLQESCVIDLYGTPTLLLHGDTLCTDDLPYQAFRRQVRDPVFQTLFLQKPIPERLHIAHSARDASQAHTTSAAMAIMDVNEQAVRAAFDRHHVGQLIHGHTHRPDIHDYILADGSPARRIVLADWRHSGHYLRVGPDGHAAITLSGR